MTDKPLTARQQKALAALLTTPTIAMASKLANVPERSIYRFLKDATFAACYREKRDRQVEQAVVALQMAVGQAVATLVEIATNAGEKSSARVQAARGLIEGALRATELHDVESRLCALETTSTEPKPDLSKLTDAEWELFKKLRKKVCIPSGGQTPGSIGS